MWTFPLEKLHVKSGLYFSIYFLLAPGFPSSWDICICGPVWKTINAVEEMKPAVKDTLQQVAPDDLGKIVSEGGINHCRLPYKRLSMG